jgi:uncharacterized OsmC-like protein
MQREASLADPTTREQALFVIPTGRGGGFEASIRGHMLGLADPADSRLAPNPSDLLIAAIASDLAWSARTLLRGLGLPDYVSVSVGWRRHGGPPRLDGIDATVTISRRAQEANDVLAAAFANGLAARFAAEPLVHISFEE